jgi:hypothetical protein
VKFDIKALYLPAGAVAPPSPAGAAKSSTAAPIVEEAAPSGRMPALKTPNASDTPGVLQAVPRKPRSAGRGA